MEVIVLGFPGTGTPSIVAALKQLGYNKIYDMREVAAHKHQDTWIAGLDAKFEGKGKPLEREDFEKLFDGFDAVAGFPAAIFYRELVTAYPHAKYILSLRDEDEWYASMSETLKQGEHAQSAAGSSEELRPLLDKCDEYVWKKDFGKHGKQAYKELNEGVYMAVPTGGAAVQLFDVKMGWEPLCRFLERDVPEAEFPRVDEGNE